MKIITLVGADASGKDTQIAMMKSHLESLGKSVQVITIWDSLSEFSAIEDKKVLKQTVETFLLKFEAEARSYFLLSCLKNSESRVDKSKDYVLLNGFYQKYWASEMAYGVSSDLWKKNTGVFLKADQMFYLNTPVEVCLARKENWSNYEQGLGKHMFAKNISKEEFQKKLHVELDGVMKEYSSAKVINGHQSTENVHKDLIKAL
jgi:thymidylate kinase